MLIGDGPERRRLAAEARAAGVQERIHLVGHQSDPLPWLHILDVYINSSRTEAMNLGILEAMAAGLPVIATDVGDAAVILGGTKPAGQLVPTSRSGRVSRGRPRLVAEPFEAEGLCRERAKSISHQLYDRDDDPALWRTLPEISDGREPPLRPKKPWATRR